MTNQEFLESITLDGEEWRDIVGYEDLYSVSTMGRVVFKSRFHNNGNGGYIRPPKIVKLMRTKHGYLQARCWRDNKEKKKYVHRLVAEAFIPNPHNYPQIDHVDTDKTNNTVENLRWCTSTQNHLNPITRKRNSLSKIGHPVLIATYSKPVVRINPKDPSDIKIYESPTFAKKTEGYNQGHISEVCRGERNLHKGYKWVWLSDYEASNQ